MTQYLKLVLISSAVILTSLFLVQNLGQLDRPLNLQLDLFVKKTQFRPMPIYALLIGAFFFGMLLTCAVGVLARLRLRKTLRRQRRTIGELEKEVKSLRNLPLAEADLSQPAGPAGIEQLRHRPQGRHSDADGLDNTNLRH